MSQAPIPKATAPVDGSDPSMEEILASIRRILNEDEPDGDTPEAAAEEPEPGDNVLVLDRSMLVAVPEAGNADTRAGEAEAAHPNDDRDEFDRIEPPGAEAAEPEAAKPEHNDFDDEPDTPAMIEPVPRQAAEPPAVPTPAEPARHSGDRLVAPETAAATASAVDGLLRTLAASRVTQVYRGGPTIEDLVREELRPLLKQWLDDHLPPVVERLVRAEIERVVGRSVP